MAACIVFAVGLRSGGCSSSLAGAEDAGGCVAGMGEIPNSGFLPPLWVCLATCVSPAPGWERAEGPTEDAAGCSSGSQAPTVVPTRPCSPAPVTGGTVRSGARRAQGTPCSTVPPSPAAARGGPGVRDGAAEPPEQGREVAPHSGRHCCSPVPIIPFTSPSGTALMAPRRSHSTDLGLFGCFATQPCVSVQRRVFLPCFLPVWTRLVAKPVVILSLAFL